MTTPPTSADGLIPGIYAAETTGSEESFTTYDATADSAGAFGFRPLQALDYVLTTLLDNPTTPANAHVLIAGTATASGNDNSILSLVLEAGGTLSLTGSQSINVTSGQVLARSGAIPATITGGTVNFGDQAGTVATFGNLDLNNAVTGTAGWSKVGPATLSIGAQPANAAQLTIGEGRVRLLAPMALASQTVTMDAIPTILDVNGHDASVGGLQGLGTVEVGDRTLTVGSAGNGFFFRGEFLGNGNVVIVDGGNPLTERELTVTTGPDRAAFTLQSGILIYSDLNTSNPNPLTIAGGALEESSFLRIPLILTGEARLRGSFRIEAPATITGPGTLHVDDGQVTLEVPAKHSGETIVTGSFRRLDVDESSALPNTSAIHLNGGQLSFAAGSGQSERINDGAPIYIRGGKLSGGYSGGASGSEIIGVIHAGPAAMISVSAVADGDTGAILDLRPAQILRVEHGVLTLETSQMTDSTAPVRTEIHPTVAPATFGGSAVSGPDTSIIPWMISHGDQLGEDRFSFTTHHATNGLRTLDLVNDYAQGLVAVSLPTNNLRFTGTGTLNSDLTVNSLLLSGHAGLPNLSGIGILTVTSGAVLSNSTLATVATPLNFGDAEALLIVDEGDMTVSGSMSGSGGLTKAGTRTLTLSGSNTFTGTMRVIEGQLRFTQSSALGATLGLIELHGTGLSYTGVSDEVLSKSIALTDRGGTIANANGDVILTVTSSIGGSGDVWFGGPVHLAGASNYTGDSHVSGTVTFSSEAALGQGGGVHLESGRLEPTFDWTTDRTVHSGHGTLWTGQNHVTLNGPLVGEETLKVSGPGTLTINDATQFLGSIEVEDGTLAIVGTIPFSQIGSSPDRITSQPGGTITGEGVWDRGIGSKSTLAPGIGIGTITALDIDLAIDSTIVLEIGSPTSYDQLRVRGEFGLGNWVNLTIDLQYDPADWQDSFMIVDNDGMDTIGGSGARLFRFLGNDLVEGETFLVGDQYLRISYIGGDGNDVMLHAVPEPGSFLLLLTAIPFLTHRARRSERS